MNEMSLKDGLLATERGGILRPGLSEQEFRGRAGEGAKPYIHNGPHRSYRVPQNDIAGRSFRPVVFFSEGIITMIELCWADPSRASNADPWKDRSEAKERDVAKENSRWLANALQGAASTTDTYSFPWGTIWSGFDPKSGGSSVVIRYTSKADLGRAGRGLA